MSVVDDARSRLGAGCADDLVAVHRELTAAMAAALEALGATDDAVELHRAACELVERDVLGRLRVLERVQAAIERLAEAGPVSEIVERAPVEAATAVELDRVLLSRIEDGCLVAEAFHCPDDPEHAAATLALLKQAPVRLDYPLLEAEMLRRRRSLLIAEGDGDQRGRQANAAILGWRDYVTSPIVLEGRVIGLLHGDRLSSGRGLGPLERDALASFARGFAEVFERAVLRRRLRAQRREMRQVASWADARTSELSDRAINLAADRDAGDEAPARMAAGPESALRDLLTRRELDVLELMVKGDTNAGIARALTVSEGTVKFHVKNILRKLHAANRAEATSRYLRLTLRRPEGAGELTGGAPWPA